MVRLPLVAWIVAALVVGCGQRGQPADLVLTAGRIVTLDEQRPEARALAVRGERIAAVGSEGEIAALVGPQTEVLDLGGALVVPGLVDGHVHLRKLGRLRRNLDLSELETWQEIVRLAGRAARDTPPGQWIYGRGWHQEKWARQPSPRVLGYPVHDALSRVTPDHPVLLRHASGHGSIVNRRAMDELGITAATPDPPGGVIVRDRGGRPVGVFLERAEDPFLEAYELAGKQLSGEQARAELIEELRLATRECLANGLTAVHDAGVPFEVLDAMAEIYSQESPGIRIYAMIDGDDELDAERLTRYRRVDDPWLTVRAIKKYMDGALGARGAWLLEPYQDQPGSVGKATDPPQEIEAVARLALHNDYQLCVHAIGDRGNREVLDIYERVFADRAGPSGLRWRIEHAQHLHPGDVPRFAALGVIASVQACHCTSDGPWVPRRLGPERARSGAYLWRELIDSGALLVNGTDAPVEDIDPMRNFHAAVTRRMADGRPFYPGQRMTREEALRSMTINAAAASFREHELGTLSPGKLADITVLSHDILEIPEQRIPETRALYTIVGGRVRYRLR